MSRYILKETLVLRPGETVQEALVRLGIKPEPNS